jgi:hypothetical protein
MLDAARREARRRFDESRRLGVDTPMQIQHALETAEILRHNVVQGVREVEQEDSKWGEFALSYLFSLLLLPSLSFLPIRPFIHSFIRPD